MTKAELTKVIKRITVLATLVIFILVGFVIFQCVKLKSLENESALLDAKINDLSITQVSLEEGIEIRTSDDYIEQEAREQLGMVKDGETVYIIK